MVYVDSKFIILALYIVHPVVVGFIILKQYSTLPTCHRHKLYSKTATDDKSKTNLSVFILNSLNGIKREKWNKLTENNPFLEYDWLHSLEQSKCASPDAGWDPIHIVIGYRNESSSDDTTFEIHALAACPLYVKYHSYGEFIFDQQWANFAQSALDLKYYPKVNSIFLIFYETYVPFSECMHLLC